MESPKPLKTALELHQSLIELLKRNGHLSSPRVEAAFRAVPRHLFLPDLELEQVYRDEAIPTKLQDEVPISSSSQPTIMAIMLEQLDLKPGQRVLEIGAGTGYNAALIAHIVGEQGQVITMDIDEDIVEQARAHLKAAGLERVQVIHADGGQGYPEAAPYDRILLSVSAADLAPAWREQLKPDGRLVLPLSLRGSQVSVGFEPRADHLASLSAVSCGFMHLRGSLSEPEPKINLGPEPGLSIHFDSPTALDAETIYTLLTERHHDWHTGVRVTLDEILWGGLSLWLASRTANTFILNAEGPALATIQKIHDSGHQLFPDLLGKPNTASTVGGLLEDGSLYLLMRRPGETHPFSELAETSPKFELFVRTFGPNAAAARHLIDHIIAWERAKRPSAAHLHLKAYPATSPYQPMPREWVISKQWSQFVMQWK
jgi:protein-L-isoaspartate(D-aspartate) O-methyltransferase